MTDFGTVVDRVKEHFQNDWLTDSQLTVFEKLVKAKGPARGRILNVHGSFGVGKTFLGWVISRVWNCHYCKSVKEIPIGSEIAIIDDFEATRENSRHLLNKMKMRDIIQVVVLSERRIADDVWETKLDLTERDISVVRANLFRISVIIPDNEYKNLWQLVNSCEAKL